MKLSEKYRPHCLADVIGQKRSVAILRGWMNSQHSACFMLQGSPGIGKTSSALAICEELGARESYRLIPCSDFTVETARNEIKALALSPMFGSSKIKVLILEELERLSPACQQFLKVALENLPRNSLVLGTSNDTSLIDPALIQRFTVLQFGEGDEFRAAANRRLAEIWELESNGAPLPRDFKIWGVDTTGQFSFRLALDRLQQELTILQFSEPEEPAQELPPVEPQRVKARKSLPLPQGAIGEGLRGFLRNRIESSATSAGGAP